MQHNTPDLGSDERNAGHGQENKDGGLRSQEKGASPK